MRSNTNATVGQPCASTGQGVHTDECNMSSGDSYCEHAGSKFGGKEDKNLICSKSTDFMALS